MMRLWKLAWPMMILGSSRVAMRTVDVLVVGFLGAWATASIGLGDVWLQLVLFLGLGLGVGTVARVSQALGAGNHDRADRSMTQAAMLSILFGASASLLFWFYGQDCIQLLGAGSRLVEKGGRYLQVVGLSAVPRMFYLVSFRGMAGAEDTLKPAIIGVSTTLINIIVTVVLVFGWVGFSKMGLMGAAIGTVCGNVLAGVACLILLNWPSYRLNMRRTGLTSWREGWRILKVGIPRVLRGGVVAVGRMLLQGILLWFGEAAVAGFQIGLRVLLLALMPNWGISAAAGTYSGQHLGLGEPGEARSQGWTAVRLSLLICGPLTAFMIYFRSTIAYLFIREQPALSLASNFIIVYGVVVFLYCVFRNLSGALEGAGHTIVPMLAAGSGTLIVLSGSFYLAGPLQWGIGAVYASILFGYLFRGLMVVGWFQYYAWSEHPAVIRFNRD